MSDVLYSDVKFTRERGNNNGTVSSQAETTYSEVRILKSASTELPGSQQRSTVTSERVALVVVSVLLAAAVVALGLTSYKLLERRTDECDTVEKTEKHSEVKPCSKCPQQPPEGKTDESCKTCGEDWEQSEGTCYYFSNQNLTWLESRGACRGRGGDLVKIDSREEQKFLELRLREKMNNPEDKFWIGLTDSVEEGRWFWTDGSALNLSLTFWSPREPDNWEGKDGEDVDGEDCVRMGEKDGAQDLKCWFDRNCKKLQRSICEKRLNCV